jgi:hypothetical protein
MALSEKRTILKAKNLVYYAVLEGITRVFSRSESFKIGLYSTYNRFVRYKSVELGRSQGCFVTILTDNNLQKHANDFRTVFSTLSIWLPVLYRCFAQPFAVRLVEKRH